MSFKIEIPGFRDPAEFMERWSGQYSYNIEYKYTDHIDTVFDNRESFLELFRWKNGTGENISVNKMKTIDGFWSKVDVLRKLKLNFSWEFFESEFQPTRSSSIWKCFLVHLIDPSRFPLYDQHVYRSYQFIHEGIIEEIPNTHRLKYEIFKEKYCEWFNGVVNEHNLNHKRMDESLFTYGQMLKSIKKYPLLVSQE